MSDFAQVLASSEPLPKGLTVEVPETWLQGRTAYGGFSSALCLAAAQANGGEPLAPLRSAQLAMIAPVSGRIRVSARVVRQGRNATWMAAEISGDRGVAFTASFVFMGPVSSDLHLNGRSLPDHLVAVQSAVPVVYTSHTPAFLSNNFEARHGLAPDGVKRPELCRWVRLHERSGLDAMVELMLIADALPPGVMPMLSAAVPVSTMHWQVNLLTPAPCTEDGWWLLRSSGDYAEHGCSSQRMDLWNTAGEPVAAGMQSIAVFG